MATEKGKWEDKTNFSSSVLTHRLPIKDGFYPYLESILSKESINIPIETLFLWMPWQPQLNLLEVQRHHALSLGLILKPSSVKLNHFLRSLIQ